MWSWRLTRRPHCSISKPGMWHSQSRSLPVPGRLRVDRAMSRHVVGGFVVAASRLCGWPTSSPLSHTAVNHASRNQSINDFNNMKRIVNKTTHSKP